MTGQLPGRYRAFIQTHEAVGKAYKGLGDAVASAGPLDEKTMYLIKLGISIGMRHEGAVHSQTRKALEAGCTPDELRHAAMLATTTLGFPGMMAAYSWVDDILAAIDEE